VAGDLGAWPDSLEGARRGFERATALEPHLPWYWLHWARFERAAGDLEAARRLAARAIAEEPNFVRGLLFSARLDLDRGQVGAARRAFDRAEGARWLARGRLLTSYERDLLRAPAWQVEEIRQALAQAVN
jgi:tetratricopeptide (TPR) repeat protein